MTQIKDILQHEPTNVFLEVLSNEKLPSNSDAVFVLSQFISALDQFEGKYSVLEDTDDDPWGKRKWQIEN